MHCLLWNNCAMKCHTSFQNPLILQQSQDYQKISKKDWFKATLKEIKKLINDQKFLMDKQEKGYPVTPCMDFYKSNIQSDVILDKLKLRIVFKGDLQNK